MNWGEMKLKMVWISYRSLKFQAGMRFSREHNLPETKWISAGSLDVAFNAHVRLKLNACMNFVSVIWQKWNFISGNKILCKHYPKWNAYTCPSKYRVVFTPVWNLRPVWVHFAYHVNELVLTLVSDIGMYILFNFGARKEHGDWFDLWLTLT